MIVIVDTTNPILIGVPEDTLVECDAIPATADVTAVDDCSTPDVSFDEQRIDSQLCDGEYQLVRTWTATDDCGNMIPDAQTIQVVDTTPPVLECPSQLPPIQFLNGDLQNP